jgi:hypothetical protein
MHGWSELQRELAQLSTKGRHLNISGASHMTIITQQEHALRVAEEIKTLLV